MYEGLEGALQFIVDISYGYDNAKTEIDFKELIDEINTEAKKAIKFKEKYRK